MKLSAKERKKNENKIGCFSFVYVIFNGWCVSSGIGISSRVNYNVCSVLHQVSSADARRQSVKKCVLEMEQCLSCFFFAVAVYFAFFSYPVLTVADVDGCITVCVCVFFFFATLFSLSHFSGLSFWTYSFLCIYLVWDWSHIFFSISLSLSSFYQHWYIHSGELHFFFSVACRHFHDFCVKEPFGIVMAWLQGNSFSFTFSI